MRKKIVAGNWKMNLTWPEAKALLLRLNSHIITHKPQSEIIIAPPFPYLDRATEIFTTHAEIASQDISEHSEGAYTGEISWKILKSIDVRCAIIGHSERREYHNETNEVISNKLHTALKADIKPILCVGESDEHRRNDTHKKFVREQIVSALYNLNHDDLKNIIIAYEPVWAIGTGNSASPQQAQEMHAYIRSLLNEKFGSEFAQTSRILYGGSVKPGNAEDLFQQKDIDGALVGGASLKAEDFTSIINAAEKNY